MIVAEKARDPVGARCAPRGGCGASRRPALTPGFGALSIAERQSATKKERTLEALIRQLDGLARQQPVLMVVEGVHWIDPTSRELLELRVERVRSLPVLLIVTFRPEFQPPWDRSASGDNGGAQSPRSA